ILFQHRVAGDGVSGLGSVAAVRSLVGVFAAASGHAGGTCHRPPPAREIDSRTGWPIHQRVAGRQRNFAAVEGYLRGYCSNQYSPLLDARLYPFVATVSNSTASVVMPRILANFPVPPTIFCVP